MRRRVKDLAEQVIVITGASSGIGLATTRMALDRGARVVAVARSPEMERIADGLRQSKDGQIESVIADVSREHDVRRAAAHAIDRFGRIDTWINNAGEAVLGRATDTPIDEMRALFDIDFWGVVYGSRVAIEHMRDAGGTLINVGSVLSDRAAPLLGTYCAAKHAMKAWTDALRVELARDRVPIQVTLIKPATIDTPLYAHAKNRLDEGYPAPPPPVYGPEVVAEALLAAATHPIREMAVGGVSRFSFAIANVAPSLADKVMERWLFDAAIQHEPHDTRAQGRGEERGDYPGVVLKRSLYTSLRALPTTAKVAATVATLWLAKTVVSSLARKEVDA